MKLPAKLLVLTVAENVIWVAKSQESGWERIWLCSTVVRIVWTDGT